MDKCLQIIDALLQTETLTKKTLCRGFKPDIFTHLRIERSYPTKAFRKTLTDQDLGPLLTGKFKWEQGIAEVKRINPFQICSVLGKVGLCAKSYGSAML